jgi:hypothetical protein
MGPAVTFLESAPRSEEERRKIVHVNAESMFAMAFRCPTAPSSRPCGCPGVRSGRPCAHQFRHTVAQGVLEITAA